jgi:hypothetical protein
MIIAAIALLFASGGEAAAQMSKLRCRGFDVKSVVPTGFRSVRATVELELVNKGKPFEMENVEVVVYRDGKPYVTGGCPLIEVEKGSYTAKLIGNFHLANGVSLWSVFRNLLNIQLEDYSADISLTEKGDNNTATEQSFQLDGVTVAEKAKKWNSK